MKKGCGCLLRLLLWICILLVCLRATVWLAKRLFPAPYGEEVRTSSREWGVDASLLYGMIKAESNFEPESTSSKGAKGLMQLMEKTAEECARRGGLPLTDLYDPGENIALGAYYIHSLLARYDGNVPTALAAYNAGQGRVDTWLSDTKHSSDGKTLSEIPYPETANYVKKVLLYQKIYEKWVLKEADKT